MAGVGKFFLGIVLVIIFFITLNTPSIPIIWTGAGVVGAIFVVQGLMEMVRGKKYQCKTCGYKGSQHDVLVHAYHTHPEMFSAEEREKLGIALGLQAPPTVEESSVDQPAPTDDEIEAPIG
jgi:hypothetical protein